MRNSERSQTKMAVYMRSRRLSKQVGMTVRQWEKAGCPAPNTVNEAPNDSGMGTPTIAAQSSPVAPHLGPHGYPAD